ncbi:MAG: four helix bundle protein [Patescibacteria group bacterium]|jgi:four helix bundle protein
MTEIIKSFFQMKSWQESHKLVLLVYKASKGFSEDERFGLSSQIRRASVSVSSNIAEGFARRSKPEKINFYSIAFGSLVEVQSQLLIAQDLGYIGGVCFTKIADQTVLTKKLLSGSIRKLKS